MMKKLNLIVGTLLLTLIATMGFSMAVSGQSVFTDDELFEFGDAPDVPFPTFDPLDWVKHFKTDAYWLGQGASYSISPLFEDSRDDATYRFGIDSDGQPFFEVDITLSENSPTNIAYLNVLADLEANDCQQVDPLGWEQASNHVVINQRVELLPGTHTYQVPAERLVEHFLQGWVRLTLSERRVDIQPNDTWDGSEALPFLLGETEDWCDPLNLAERSASGRTEMDTPVPPIGGDDCETCLAARDNMGLLLSIAEATFGQGLQLFTDEMGSSNPDFSTAYDLLDQALEALDEFKVALDAYRENCGAYTNVDLDDIADAIDGLVSGFQDAKSSLQQAETFLNNGDRLGAVARLREAWGAYDTALTAHAELLCSFLYVYEPVTFEECVVIFEVKKSSAADVEVGESFIYTITITNTGNVDAFNVVLWEILPDGVTVFLNDGGCTQDGPGDPFRCEIGDLPAGAFISIHFQVRADVVGTLVNNAYVRGYSQQGSYAGAGTYNQVNVSAANVNSSKPDLVIVSVEFNENCDMTVTIKNIGDADAQGSFTYSTTDFDNGNIAGTVFSSAINGLVKDGEVSQTWENTQFSANTTTILVDPGNNIDESNEGNNSVTVEVPTHCQKSATSTTNTQAKPDLVITSVEFNENCDMTVTVTNVGNQDAVGLFDYSATNFDNGNISGTVFGEAINGLGAGSGISQTWIGTQFSANTTTLTVDPSNSIDESNEGNNTFTVDVPEHCRKENNPPKDTSGFDELLVTVEDAYDRIKDAISAGESGAYGAAANMIDDVLRDFRRARTQLNSLNEEFDFEALGINDVFDGVGLDLSRAISAGNSFKRALEDADEESRRTCPPPGAVENTRGPECDEDDFEQNAKDIFERGLARFEATLPSFESFEENILTLRDC